MSPIFVRPVREQLEHDRLVRFLVAKYKRKFEVAVNMGDERVAPVKVGPNNFFPDLLLSSARKVAGVVEVESAESVNNLEALAQWVHFAKARVPFHLYVPVQAYDAARRLCDANHAHVTELWTYRPLAEGFDLVRMASNNGPAPRWSSPRLAKPVVPKAPAPTPKAPSTPVVAVVSKSPKAQPAPKPDVVKKAAPAGKKADPGKKPQPAKKAAKVALTRKKAKPAPRKPAGARKR